MGRRRKPRPGDSLRGVLVVDKPKGPTSHDVVQWARRALQTRQVGHAGTLDPMATGVLVLAIGQGTRLVPYLTADDKRYEATIALGAETDTLDAGGEVTERAPVPEDVDEAAVRDAAAGFIGTLPQRAPRVSAIKVDGKALHQRVRDGEDVEAPVREVTCHAIDVLAVRRDEAGCASAVDVRVHCGKGYYIRSLGRDLARSLGTRGHLTALRRTASGAFGQDEAYTIPTGPDLRVRDESDRAAAVAALLPLPEAVRGMPRVRTDAAGVVEARHGRAIPAASLADAPQDAEVFALLDESGALVALARPDDDGGARVVRGFPPPAPPPAEDGESRA